MLFLMDHVVESAKLTLTFVWYMKPKMKMEEKNLHALDVQFT